MFKKWIQSLFSSVNKEVEEQKALLLQGLAHPWPRPEYVLIPARKLLELGVSKDEVADMLSNHTNFFDVMDFAMTLRPSLAEKFAESSLSSAKAHFTLCGHLDRAHWARNSIEFAAKCYDKVGFRPDGFQELRDNIFKKTAWAF